MASGNGVFSVNDEPAQLASLQKVSDQIQVFAHKRTLAQLGSTSTFLRTLASRHGVNLDTAAARLTLDELFMFAPDTLTVPLLKLKGDAVSRAVRLSSYILLYLREPGSAAPSDMACDAAQTVCDQVVRRAELRDEVYLQLVKQTRRNPSVDSTRRGWELLVLLASVAPPSAQFVEVVQEHMHTAEDAFRQAPSLLDVVQKAGAALRRCLRYGARVHAPSVGEVRAALRGRTPKTSVRLMDGSSCDVLFHVNTTVLDAMKQLIQELDISDAVAGSFAMFIVQLSRLAAATSAQVATGGDSSRLLRLTEKRYVGDVLVELEEPKSSGVLLLRKHMFVVGEEMADTGRTLGLAYAQAQVDLLEGNYPSVSREQACWLCVLQMCVAEVPECDKDAVLPQLQRFLPPQVVREEAWEAWAPDVALQYTQVVSMQVDVAQQQFLQQLRALPHGLSCFFQVELPTSPLPSLPRLLMLGVNDRGVHIFQRRPRELVHSASHRNVTQFASDKQGFYLSLRMPRPGQPSTVHHFSFTTPKGAEVCFTLQCHMNDAMRQKYVRTKAISEALSVDVSRALSIEQSATGAIMNPVPEPGDEQMQLQDEISGSLAQLQTQLSTTAGPEPQHHSLHIHTPPPPSPATWSQSSAGSTVSTTSTRATAHESGSPHKPRRGPREGGSPYKPVSNPGSPGGSAQRGGTQEGRRRHRTVQSASAVVSRGWQGGDVQVGEARSSLAAQAASGGGDTGGLQSHQTLHRHAMGAAGTSQAYGTSGHYSQAAHGPAPGVMQQRQQHPQQWGSTLNPHMHGNHHAQHAGPGSQAQMAVQLHQNLEGLKERIRSFCRQTLHVELDGSQPRGPIGGNPALLSVASTVAPESVWSGGSQFSRLN